MEAPKFTYYARVLENFDYTQVVGYRDTAFDNIWYYGQCNGLRGGESQYVVEFDIWNNEPGFKGGMSETTVSNAYNCRLSVFPNEDLALTSATKDDTIKLFGLTAPFFYARCVTHGYKIPFSGIRYKQYLEGITGNMNPDKPGIIQGTGDHAVIQTKIVLPANTGIPTNRYGFGITFYYDYE
jgi:hypothetical protein